MTDLTTYEAAKLAAGVVLHRANHAGESIKDLPGDHEFIADAIKGLRLMIGARSLPYDDFTLSHMVWGAIGLIESSNW
jgi:hypothetical protein